MRNKRGALALGGLVLVLSCIGCGGEVFAGIPETLTLDASLAGQRPAIEDAIQAWNNAFTSRHTLVDAASGDLGLIYEAPRSSFTDTTTATYEPRTGRIAVRATLDFFVSRYLLHEVAHGHGAEHTAGGVMAAQPQLPVVLEIDEEMRGVVCGEDRLCCHQTR